MAKHRFRPPGVDDRKGVPSGTSHPAAPSFRRKFTPPKDGAILSKKWAIIGTGPSMTRCLERMDPEAKVVAINHALTCSVSVRVDVLCLMDPPDQFPIMGDRSYDLAYLVKFMPSGMRVWAPSARGELWRMLTMGGNKLDVPGLDLQLEPNDWREPFNRFKPDDRPRFECMRTSHISMNLAIRGALTMGATEIDIFGCDMEGLGNPVQGLKDDNNKSRNRWRRERDIMQAIMELCHEHGIRVRRICPDAFYDHEGRQEYPAGALPAEDDKPVQVERTGAVPDDGGGDRSESPY
ncbi:MAG: hypothetical protein ACI88C_000074 [Acidimicrobiales bacterium]|jgi:hypothetical protein